MRPGWRINVLFPLSLSRFGLRFVMVLPHILEELYSVLAA